MDIEPDADAVNPVRRFDLADLVSRINSENRHDEIDWGVPRGNEVW